MVVKTIKFEDFDGRMREEDFRFNLSPAEVYDLQKSMNGGLNALLEQIIKEQDEVRMTEYMKKLVTMSYGVKSLDGRNFRKSPEILADFVSTNAFSEIYMTLTHDADAAVDFVNGILPSREALERYTKMMEASLAKMDKEQDTPTVDQTGIVPISNN
ncbi:MAG: hypothetical protein IJ716_14320 [Lachnospiraceae bacterium]|nr:hypothetical protein [Lachnospiraceae bacterium]